MRWGEVGLVSDLLGNMVNNYTITISSPTPGHRTTPVHPLTDSTKSSAPTDDPARSAIGRKSLAVINLSLAAIG